MSPLRAAARRIIERRGQTMTYDEAESALREALVHLRERALANIETDDAVEIARQYEAVAKVVAELGTVHLDEIEREEESN